MGTEAYQIIGSLQLRSTENVVIRAEDLQFSTDEAVILFTDKMGFDLKPEQIEALNARTEGWIVGFQVAALSLKGHSSYEPFIEGFTGNHQFILDYLTEEVLGHCRAR